MPDQRPKLSWEDPPPKKGSTIDSYPIAEELKKRPGRWAMIRVLESSASAGTAAQRVRLGIGGYKPKGAFEAMARTVDGEHRVYARYIGEENG